MQFMYLYFFPEYSNFATFWIYLLANSHCDCYENLVTRHEWRVFYSLPLLLKPVSLPVHNVASVFFFLYVCFRPVHYHHDRGPEAHVLESTQVSPDCPEPTYSHVPKQKWKAMSRKYLFKITVNKKCVLEISTFSDFKASLNALNYSNSMGMINIMGTL